MAVTANYIQSFIKLPVQFFGPAFKEHVSYFNQWYIVQGTLNHGAHIQDVYDDIGRAWGMLGLIIGADFNPGGPVMEAHFWAKFGGTVTGPTPITPGAAGWPVGVLGIAGPSVCQVKVNLRNAFSSLPPIRKYFGALPMSSMVNGRYIEPIPGAMDLLCNRFITPITSNGLQLLPAGVVKRFHDIIPYTHATWRDSSPDGGANVWTLKRRGKRGWAKPLPPYPMQEP